MVWPQNPTLPGSTARLCRKHPKKGVARPVQSWLKSGTASPRPAPGLPVHLAGHAETGPFPHNVSPSLGRDRPGDGKYGRRFLGAGPKRLKNGHSPPLRLKQQKRLRPETGGYVRPAWGGGWRTPERSKPGSPSRRWNHRAKPPKSPRRWRSSRLLRGQPRPGSRI